MLLVEVPEAEPVVREHRLRLDPVTEKGVPAHVTALFPFVTVNGLDDEVLDCVLSVAARHPAFEDAWVGVKCTTIRGCWVSQARTF